MAQDQKMGEEIERRFIVIEHDYPETLNFKAGERPFERSVNICQRVIEGEDGYMLRVRVEQQTYPAADIPAYTLCFKSGRGKRMDNWEREIPAPMGERLLMSRSSRIFKKRVSFGRGIFLDAFRDELTGLFMIEFELMEGMDALEVRKPKWIHRWVEVTGRVTNAALASRIHEFDHCSQVSMWRQVCDTFDIQVD